MIYLGAFTVATRTIKILSSTIANGSDITHRLSREFNHKPTPPPLSNSYTLNPDLLRWHEKHMLEGEVRNP